MLTFKASTVLCSHPCLALCCLHTRCLDIEHFSPIYNTYGALRSSHPTPKYRTPFLLEPTSGRCRNRSIFEELRCASFTAFKIKKIEVVNFKGSLSVLSGPAFAYRRKYSDRRGRYFFLIFFLVNTEIN